MSSVMMTECRSQHSSAHNGSSCCSCDGSSVMVMVIIDHNDGRGGHHDRRRRRDVDRGSDDYGGRRGHVDGSRGRRSHHHWSWSIGNGMGEVVEADLVYGDVSSDVEGSDVMGVPSVVEMRDVHSIHVDREVAGMVLDLEMEVGSHAEGKGNSLLAVPVTIVEVVEYDGVLLESYIHVQERPLVG